MSLSTESVRGALSAHQVWQVEAQLNERGALLHYRWAVRILNNMEFGDGM